MRERYAPSAPGDSGKGNPQLLAAKLAKVRHGGNDCRMVAFGTPDSADGCASPSSVGQAGRDWFGRAVAGSRRPDLLPIELGKGDSDSRVAQIRRSGERLKRLTMARVETGGTIMDFWGETNWYVVQSKPHEENLAAASVAKVD